MPSEHVEGPSNPNHHGRVQHTECIYGVTKVIASVKLSINCAVLGSYACNHCISLQFENRPRGKPNLGTFGILSVCTARGILGGKPCQNTANLRKGGEKEASSS